MSAKKPVILLVLVNNGKMSWNVVAVDLHGNVTPLLQSERGDLAAGRDRSFDEQASFLRHRFCGIIQRGWDRLWQRSMKAHHFVIAVDSDFPETAAELTLRTAEHLAGWMVNPPLSFHRLSAQDTRHSFPGQTLAGTLPDDLATTIAGAMPEIMTLSETDDVWENVPPPPTTSE